MKCLLSARYKPLCPETWPNYAGKAKDGVAILCNYLSYGHDEYRMGQSVPSSDPPHFDINPSVSI